jgi:molybdate transport system substrate-binding protein
MTPPSLHRLWRPLQRIALLLAIVTVALVAGITAARADTPPTVAAASDLQFALTEIARAYQAATGAEVKLVFGSSGNLRRQIAAGAPFQMFMSADEAYVEALAAEGRTEDGGIRYAIGRLALFVPTGSPLRPDATLADLTRAAADGRVARFAIANPEHAPYGRAAREALQRVGAWALLEPRLVLGETVSQAAQFAASGAAQGGIIAYSIARSPALAGKGHAVLLPAHLHAPLYQRMVLVKGATPSARAFYAYMQQSVARAALQRHGFALPDA